MPTETTPTTMVVWAPTRIRLKTSMPIASVPSQCSGLGPCSRWPGVTRVGSNGVQNSDTTAIDTTAATRTIPHHRPARLIGVPARYVCGYFYTGPRLDNAAPEASHAWVQVYLPGAGWVEFDPTNGIIGGRNLIRVGVARDPRQAIPLAGSFTGSPQDYLGMTVEVRVERIVDGGLA